MYRLPAKDYDFLLRHVTAGQSVLDAVTGGEVTFTDVGDVLELASAVAEEVLLPLNQVGDRVGCTVADGHVTTPPGFADAYKTFTEGGWIGLGVPARSGGTGMPQLLARAADEILCSANLAFSLVGGLTTGAIMVFDAVGDDTLRRTFLPPMLAGRWTGTMNLTEPQAGTDLAQIRTMARPSGDGTWSVTGQKIFITWGEHDLAENIVHLVLARTPDAPPGHAGLSLFVVPKYLPGADGRVGERNSLTCVSLERKLGIHASPTCVMEYGGATGYLIGELHRGLPSMFIMMNAARMGTGVQALAVADRAYRQAEAYSRERVQSPVPGREPGAPIGEHPDVRRLLLSMGSAVSAMRGLASQTSVWLDLGQSDPQARRLAEFFLPVVKGWLTETGQQIASDAVQVHGGMGFIEETGVAQHYRDIRILPIYEGTTAVQANSLLGRQVARNGGALARTVCDLIEQSLAELDAHDHPAARRVASRTRSAAAGARSATDTLVKCVADRPRDAYAGAVAYLNLWGLLAGGWIHARILNAVLNGADPDTADQRIREADCYAVHHLGRIPQLVEIIEAGEIA